MLRHLLQVDDFNLDAWRSKIRDEVSDVNEYYTDLDKWDGDRYESSDIVYTDNTGLLARTLNDIGYTLVPRVSKLQFNIEVKTTTLDWNETLYVSKRQKILVRIDSQS